MSGVSETPPPPYGEQPPEQPGQQPGQPYQSPYGQPAPPYGQPVPYGQPNPYGQQPYGAVQDHPQATLILILGILGLVVCGVLAPFAWVMGNRVVREIDASNGAIGGRSMANAGRICGIVGSVLIILGLVLFVVIFLLAGIATVSSSP
jgi:hypothetical protein